jgi:Asp-tRNA(Asn)/Glu-tRNA(Gln) amidotransferase A subunit family amidase
MSNIFLDFSIPQILQKIYTREFSYIDLANTTINSINQHEKETLSWVSYNLNAIKLELEKLEKHRNEFSNQKLTGIPFGVKDIFNTKDFCTEMGTPIWKDFTSGNNARVVDSIVSEGGIIVGKTVTAEFAVHGLNKTLNPHSSLHTPGTSSSGSAASVSRGMVPFSLATQTAGSIIRPASFCGVWGMKPSFGLIPRTGCLKTADSLDSIGFLTTHGKNLRCLLDSSRVSGSNYPFVYNNVDSRGAFPKNIKKPWRVGFVKTNIWEKAEEYTKKEITNFINKLSKHDDFVVTEISWPDEFSDVHKNHSTIYNKSLSYYFKNEKEVDIELLTPLMSEMISKGEGVDIKEYSNALDFQENFCTHINELFSHCDIVISLATAGSAPLRKEKVIDDPSLLWSFGHLPAIAAPQFRSPEGLPFAVQLIAKKWDDYLLMQCVEDLIDKGLIETGSQPILQP